MPSTAGILVRVRRTRISRPEERELYSWAYEVRSQLPRPVSFEYKVQLTRDGPFDRLARAVTAGDVIRGTVILPTAGPVWIDARLIG